MEPDKNTEPVNWCVSSGVSPNIVEPLCANVVVYVVDDDIIYSFASILPLTIKSSWIKTSPFLKYPAYVSISGPSTPSLPLSQASAQIPMALAGPPWVDPSGFHSSVS